jgi:hypothetical protein
LKIRTKFETFSKAMYYEICQSDYFKSYLEMLG